MAYQETQFYKQQSRAHRLTGSGLSGQAILPGRRSRDILEAHLDRLLTQLARPDAEVDTDLARQALSDLSADLGSGMFAFRSSDYRWILERLTGIYAQGFGRRKGDPFTITATAYAQVIETLSHAYPGYDYEEIIGQLFCYMSRLFRAQKPTWKEVYRHILSIPDAVDAKQLLNRAFFVEIQEWAEAGVDNLFSIRRERYEKVEGLRLLIDSLDRRIVKISDEQKQCRQKGTVPMSSNLIDLETARRKRLLASLECERENLVERMEGERYVVALIESDIREFAEKLRNTRRAYFIRSV